ncbi:NUDIX hydrolase [Candidatus Saccharibacteria bacterium]|nr:NUDIX hydrolase [Candidatus Saccharibacteria bacterium]
MHYIQKYILDKLIYAKELRNRDMRPPHTESNLYQYHLKRLVDSGYVEHDESGYTLSGKGLQYADKHSSDLKEQRPQPKLVTILRLENEKGEILLVPRKKQPFIGMYNLPSGKIHEGETLLSAGQRELREKVGAKEHIELTPAGAVHLTITDGETIVSESYGFILRGSLHSCNADQYFFGGESEQRTVLMPGVEALLQREQDHSYIFIDVNSNIC